MTEGTGPAYLVVLITAGNIEEANKIASELLGRRKAACVNIVPGVNSQYWWQGKIESARESLLIIKTKAAQLDAIVELVKQIHGYSVPEIIALPVVGGNPDYLEWMGREVD